MRKGTKKGTIIGCSVLRDEIEVLRKEFWPEWKTEYLPSLLHMNPTALAEKLGDRIHLMVSEGRKVVMVYGDCCHAMASFEHEPGIIRTAGVNCIELVLGKTEYRTLIREGAFFLLPEWTVRWKEIFTRELGLSPDNAADLMGEMHTRIVYLDTGVVQIPLSDIAECSRYCGLPYAIRKVALSTLRSVIETAMNRLEEDR